ncbi:hypothetical protein [Algibacillus agarilyticus]|uniref:hypothetical protein n=1 Tax=Algibacillus agarilyticus TaxID=2234133 RepID=UPI000DD04871|nr:hypothetical protein [Algibacillus agarilyticus]
MKPILFALGLASAAGATTYYASQMSNDELMALENVPADTVLFSGQLEAFPLTQYMQTYQASFGDPTQVMLMLDETFKPENPEAQFSVNLIKHYLTASQSADDLKARFGFGDDVRMLVYTVGLLPVFRYEIADAQALWSSLDTLASEAGITPEKVAVDAFSYVKYPVVNNDGVMVELAVSVIDGWASITINTPINTPEDLNIALAIEKPKNALAAESLQAITDKYAFDGSSVGFIDHVQIIKGLTQAEGNAFGRMLTNLAQLTKPDMFNSMREQACATDFSAIANAWPRTVMGTRHVEIDNESSSIKAALAVESTNQETNASLGQLRGFIPQHVYNFDNQIANVAFGFDVDELTPVLMQFWTEFTNADYTCESLVAAQTKISQTSPMMLGMFTGMVGGVKGISATIFDFELDLENEQVPVKGIEALITLSANAPLTIFNGLKALYPPLADVTIPEDGSPLAVSSFFPLPPALGLNPQVAVKGNHVVIYQGDKAAAVADNLTNEALVNNGVNAFSVDYKSLFGPLNTVLESTGKPIPEGFTDFAKLDMQVQVSTDYTVNGIEIETTMDTQAVTK